MYEVIIYDKILDEVVNVFDGGSWIFHQALCQFLYDQGARQLPTYASRLAEGTRKQAGVGNRDSIRSGIQSCEDATEALRIGIESLRGGLNGGPETG